MIKIDSIFYTIPLSVLDAKWVHGEHVFVKQQMSRVSSMLVFFVIYNYPLLLFQFYPVIREITFLSVTKKK
jgi:hypothetical protein